MSNASNKHLTYLTLTRENRTQGLLLDYETFKRSKNSSWQPSRQKLNIVSTNRPIFGSQKYILKMD